MRELTKEQIQTLADTLGVPVGPEELDEVAARFNALLLDDGQDRQPRMAGRGPGDVGLAARGRVA